MASHTVKAASRALWQSRPGRRIMAALVMGAALVVAACGTTTTPGGRPTATVKPTATPTPVPCTTWRVVPSPNGIMYPGNELSAVSALSSTAAWAVGSTAGEGTVGPVVSLIEQWNGSAWQIASNPGTAFLSGVTAVSPTDVWAVGHQWESTGGGMGGWTTATMHWNGSTWSVIPSATPNSVENTLTGIVAITANDVWAVGHYSTAASGSVPLIEHWSGTAWQIVSSPAVPGTGHGFLTAVAKVPGTPQLWAVGYTVATSSSAPAGLLIERWDGTAWQVMAAPTFPAGASGRQLNGVVALSATDAWAVGDYTANNHTIRALIVHWDGTAWQVATSPDVWGSLASVAAAAPQDVRAVGKIASGDGNNQHTSMEQWDGATWRLITIPEPTGAGSSGLSSITTDSAGTYWAVGSYFAGGSFHTLTEHCP